MNTHITGLFRPRFIRLMTILFVLPLVSAKAQTPSPSPADPYAPARALVADLDRIVTANGIQETFEATLGGARQVVNVRGADRDNPILIFVHGGPGAVEMPFAWAFQRPWEDFLPSYNTISVARGVLSCSKIRKRSHLH